METEIKKGKPKMKGKGNMAEVVLFAMSILLLVGAAFLYLRKEDNDFSRFVNLLSEVKNRLDVLEKSQADVLNAYAQRLDAAAVEIEEIRVKNDALSKSQRNVNVTFSKPVPISLVYKKQSAVIPEAPAPTTKKTRTPLLERAGVKAVNGKSGH
jgi:hypothetical protein